MNTTTRIQALGLELGAALYQLVQIVLLLLALYWALRGEYAHATFDLALVIMMIAIRIERGLRQ